MLQRLYIKNFVLIQELEVFPNEHLTIISGETGAGKSILLGAIRLLAGDKSDVKYLLDVNEKCIVEGDFKLKTEVFKDKFEQFDLELSHEITIRREIASSGKSRAFINDTLVSLEILKSFTEDLIDIHSQHDTLLVAQREFQLHVLDDFADNLALRQRYKECYRAYLTCEQEVEMLQKRAAQSQKERDLEEYLYKELSTQVDQNDDISELERELAELENIEEVQAKFQELIEISEGSDLSLEKLMVRHIQSLSELEKILPEFSIHKERWKDMLSEMKQYSKTYQRKLESMEPDPERMVLLKDKLNVYHRLFKKHLVSSVGELISIRDTLAGQLSELTDISEKLLIKIEERKELLNNLTLASDALRTSRQDAAILLSSKIIAALAKLSMNSARFEIRVEPIQFGPSGADKVEFWFSANVGKPMALLKHAVSGGEMSRLMFSLKYVLAEKYSISTIVFDEIDTGISGEVAKIMATMVSELSAKHQLMVITHLPIMASKGSHHLLVYKYELNGQNLSQIKLLDSQDRIVEIGKMLGGSTQSLSAIQHAKELLEGKN